MTKARARERAKAKAGKKIAKRQTGAQHGTSGQPGKFDPGAGSIRKAGGGVNTGNFAESRRGAARSR